MAIDTVKSTQAGRDAVKAMLNIVDANLEELLSRFKAQGDILADPENFEGPSAGQYRAEWGPLTTNLQNTKQQIHDLVNDLQNINNDIQRAGGNAT